MTEAEKLMQRWNAERTWLENTERQKKALKLIDYYNGEQLDYLDAVLAEQFADPKALKPQKSMDNIVQMVADKISRVFDSAPKLTCENQAGQKLLDELMEDGKLPLILKTSEVYANLTEVCGLHPWYDDKRDKIKTKIMPSYLLWVVQAEDDPTEADAVIYRQCLRNNISFANTEIFTYWDNLFSRRFQGTGADVQPWTENPYGLTPFAWMRNQIAVDAFFGDFGEYLINAQERLNVMLTELNQLIKMQSFSQPVMVGCENTKNPIGVDPSKPIMIPKSLRDETPPDFKFVTPQARIADVQNEIDKHIERVCARFDIETKAVRQSGAPISGYALKLTEKGLNRRREDSLPLARQCLMDWWKIVKSINNYHRPESIVPDDAGLIIDFADPVYEEDPSTLADVDKKRIDMGSISIMDVIRRDNPDLTTDEAKAKFEENMAYKKASERKFGLADLLSGSGGSNGAQG